MGSRSLERLRLCLDSSIIIDALNGVEEAIAELAGADELYMSVVSRIEVLVGCRSEESERLARSTLANLGQLELTEDIAEQTVRLRRTTRLKLPDAIILATARVHGLTLSTRNTKDFPADDPGIRIPYELP